jgi:hypothetical protein
MIPYFKYLSLIYLLSFGQVFSQAADLVLQSNVTQAYEDTLRQQEEECNLILLTPSADTLTMKAYAKRAVIHIALIHVDNWNFRNSGQEVCDSLDFTNNRFEDWLDQYIETINFDNVDSMLVDLKDLFIDPRYTEMKDELIDIRDNFEEDFDSLGVLVKDYAEDNLDHLDQIHNDFRAIDDSSVAFNFRIQVLGSKNEEIMLFTESNFYNMDSVLVYLEDGADLFEEAGAKLDSLQDGLVSPEDMTAAFRSAFSSIDDALFKLDGVLTTEPISTLQPDTTFVSEIQDFLADVDTVFAGKEYDIGNEGKTIRPVAFLENPIDDFGRIIEDFYKTSNRFEYTFGNLFPVGLPTEVVNQLKENMVLNANDDKDQIDARMAQLKNDYLDSLAVNPNNSAAHLGAALTKTYFFMKDLSEELDDFAGYLDSADFRKNFNWKFFRQNATADSICDHFEKAKTDNDMVFTILTVDNDQPGNYQIQQNSGIIPTYIFNGQLEMMGGLVNDLANARDEIIAVIDSIYAQLDSMFVLDLDPNYLDFSNVQTELEFIAVLEQSNPDFLDIKPYGVQKFTEALADLREAFSKFATTTGHFREFINTMTIHEDDFNIDGDEFRNFAADMDDFFKEVNDDFQYPDSTTMFDTTRVNLSAWFDNPPNDLLLKFKWYYDDDINTDNTLGGLFPDRGFGTATDDSPKELPATFSLAQNYPNPFNPSTIIKYILPKAEKVEIEVFNLLGQNVKTLLNKRISEGVHEVEFDAKGLPSGVYIYRLKAGDFQNIKKMLYLK